MIMREPICERTFCVMACSPAVEWHLMLNLSPLDTITTWILSCFVANQKSYFKSFKLRKNCSNVVYPGQASRWKGCFKNSCFFPQLSLVGRISSFFRSLSVLGLGSRAYTQEERRVLITNSKDFLLNILYTASYCCPKYCSNIFKKG